VPIAKPSRDLHDWPVRRLLAYFVTAPLVILGVVMAHQASYIAVAGHDDAAQLLASTGHGYMSHAPIGFAAIGVVMILALAFDAICAVRQNASTRVLPVWPFAVAGPAAFFLQEHVERYLSTGHIPWAASLEATFILGLFLQAPAAALSYAVARRLIESARHLAGAIARRLSDYVTTLSSGAAPFRTRRVPCATSTTRALRHTAPGRAPPLTISHS
jgi:hypothetical protein